MRIMRYVGTIALSLWLAGMSGQFQNLAPTYGIDFSIENALLGNGVSFYDFDLDGWDDITFAHDWGDPIFYRNTGGNGFELLDPFFTNSKNMRCILWVDYDNDGDPDLFVTYEDEPVELWQNDGEYNFTNVTEAAQLPQFEVDTYAATWADYDRDGFLDVYVDTYYFPGDPFDLEHLNHLYRNLGDGTFEETTINAGVDNGYASSFTHSFWDYNNDLWPDLYVVNDKLFANVLYKNDGDGTFTNTTFTSNLNVVIDGMSASAADYNRDGFLDMYCTNNEAGNMLFSNDGDGTFTNTSINSGTQLFEFSWEANWIDYNNDTWPDLYVNTEGDYNGNQFVGNQNFMLKNNGNGTFTPVMNELNLNADNAFSYCSAVGDFNNDGRADIVQSNHAPFPAKLWRNATPSGHSITIDLEGVVSNKEAVGCWINVFCEDEELRHYTFLGENYLSQNSQRKLIGLGNYTVCDSIEVLWISGHRDVLYNVDADQSLVLVEGFSLEANIVAEQVHVCQGDSIPLAIDIPGSYAWSTGFVGDTLWVSGAGEYHCVVTNPFGLVTTTQSLVVSEIQPTEYDAEITPPHCAGGQNGSIVLELADGFQPDSVLWDHGDEGLAIDSLTAGTYQATALDSNGCIVHFEIVLADGDTLSWEQLTTNPTCYGAEDGFITFSFPSDGLAYFVNGENETSFDVGAGAYTYEFSNELGCTNSTEILITQPDSLYATLTYGEATESNPTDVTVEIAGGTDPYQILWSNGDTTLTTQLYAGTNQECTITDANGCIYTVVFDIALNITNGFAIESLIIFPNPASTSFWVQSSGTRPNEVTLINSVGTIVERWSMTSTQQEFVISHLPNGIYFIKVANANATSGQRLIKL
ncbi:MAG: VCBS repeat-containing protein [Flavobacteriales bacterium]|nr:VCBS repeat-containing protein [Flavobacteriales bacterium]